MDDLASIAAAKTLETALANLAAALQHKTDLQAAINQTQLDLTNAQAAVVAARAALKAAACP